MAGERGKARIIIEGGTLLTMVDGDEPVHDARVIVSGDSIEGVCDRRNTLLPRAAEVINAHDAIILPGLINSHVHSPMTLFRGMADDLPLKTWLFDHIFPAEARHINEDTVYWASLLGYLEMIAAGTTTCVDSYFVADAMATAIARAGMRALVAQGVIDFPAPGVPDPKENLDVASAFLEKWRDSSDLITPGVFCHSPLTCSQETLQGAHEITTRYGSLLQIHLSETREEPLEIENKTGLRPALYLDDLGLLNSSFIAVHALYVDEDELNLLAEREVKIVHCPESNMKLGSGMAAVGKMKARGITLGLGTDGCASNNNLDLLSEMDTAAKLAKVASLDPTLLDARTVLKMATSEGARVTGLEGKIGTIEAGKKADIIIVDASAPHMTPLYNPYSQLVYSATGGDVRDVIINGKLVYRDRRFTTLDSHEIMDEVRRLSRRIS